MVETLEEDSMVAAVYNSGSRFIEEDFSPSKTLDTQSVVKRLLLWSGVAIYFVQLLGQGVVAWIVPLLIISAVAGPEATGAASQQNSPIDSQQLIRFVNHWRSWVIIARLSACHSLISSEQSSVTWTTQSLIQFM